MALHALYDRCTLLSDVQDCPHVSRTKEDFYTVRCQVTDMKNLYVSNIHRVRYH